MVQFYCVSEIYFVEMQLMYIWMHLSIIFRWLVIYAMDGFTTTVLVSQQLGVENPSFVNGALHLAMISAQMTSCQTCQR